MTISIFGALRSAVFSLCLWTGAACAVPITFQTTGSSVQTYFEGHPLATARSRLDGLSGALDLTRDTPVLANYFKLFAGTGPADESGVSGIQYRTHALSMTVMGITRSFEVDIGMQEIANGQYQLYAFDLPTLTFDLGATGVLTVTPDPLRTQSVQFLANTPLYHFRDVRANFELTGPLVSAVPEPGSLALTGLAVGFLCVMRRRRNVLCTN
ncbi:PEP-CTERM sorting domain-containing protein [Methyloversatilis sp.]|uniref:PEP-CTERM sorting domain-containing protein n=1 Tax=Methyloversatilis sp. TaxID=2569862 RepID=UPI002736F997|nr:PEP-CTERM sorting domain-containing protein [Methyloversatilis sp.]MDP2867302.1 PEP-CTERM sorting domain-containing protein [Methyloversatilis sp.]MDP3454233.1 PEP-CTERM sorting domain-containing protein [Methyloversatilis sp.]MDP3579867.1 PEP-CTERM sorting domain-containing protein [Methyloversatilis sp.]